MKDVLVHHGILGQKWGKRNGPPYPLKGGDYSKEEVQEIYKARKNKNSIYNKKHFDKEIKTTDKIYTLSYNKDRTKDTDMFYAITSKKDYNLYNSMFNKKIPQDIYDSEGNSLGTGEFYKWKIVNRANRNLKVASEDEGAKSFRDMYHNDRDFYNFVVDPERMQSYFVKEKYKFKGYREAADALDRIRSTDRPTEKDLKIAYRMFNYVIPYDGSTAEKDGAKKGKDVATQRAKVFNDLKRKGYSAMLDTNDALYGAFKADTPVIVFDMEPLSIGSISRVSTSDKTISELSFIGRKALGL